MGGGAVSLQHGKGLRSSESFYSYIKYSQISLMPSMVIQVDWLAFLLDELK